MVCNTAIEVDSVANDRVSVATNSVSVTPSAVSVVSNSVKFVIVPVSSATGNDIYKIDSNQLSLSGV